jgi:hypothetical protein
MYRFTIFFSTVNALHVSGDFSAHHQELKNCTQSIWYVPGLFAATASARAMTIIKNIVKRCILLVVPKRIHWWHCTAAGRLLPCDPHSAGPTVCHATGSAQHLAYTPNISPFKIHILGTSKGAISVKSQRVCTCMLSSDVQGYVIQRFMRQPKEFFADGTHQVMHQGVRVGVVTFFLIASSTFNCEHPWLGFTYTCLILTFSPYVSLL